MVNEHGERRTNLYEHVAPSQSASSREKRRSPSPAAAAVAGKKEEKAAPSVELFVAGGLITSEQVLCNYSAFRLIDSRLIDSTA